MKVEIQEVRRFRAQLDAVNKPLLGDIEFVLDGVPVEVPPEVSDQWEMTGLNNVDFLIALLDGDVSDLEQKMRIFMGVAE